GVRWADTMRVSWATPSSARTSAVWRMVGQSDWLPIMIPTTGNAAFVAFVAPLPACGTIFRRPGVGLRAIFMLPQRKGAIIMIRKPGAMPDFRRHFGVLVGALEDFVKN